MKTKFKEMMLKAVTLSFAVAMILSAVAHAQTSSAALSGIIADSTGARVPGAAIVLQNQASKDKRSTKANADGIFSFSGVDPGKYSITINLKGFETYVETDIELHPGDTSTLPTIAMKVGSEGETITVTSHDLIATNGEVSSLITAEDIQHLSTEGRDVTELVKILPGFALQPGDASNGGLSNTAPGNEVVGPGGSLGNYASNGAPSNGVGLISDGANVQDPGAGGATTQTINMDMVQEVKVSTSNFGADTAKGPVIINAVGKSGGQVYHGSVYIIARTSQLNSQDWLLKYDGDPKPHDRYLYPGFSIGGPIRIPGTNFNSQKKLLFLIGGEDYIQRNAFLGGTGASALHLSTVPTDAMRGGDFSLNSLANLFNVSPSLLGSGTQSQCNPNGANPSAGTLYIFANFCQQLTGYTHLGNPVLNGVFNPADIDPGAAVYLNSLIPHQNRLARPILGTTQPSDAFDRSDVYLTNYDLYQLRGRVDFNASQANKFYAVYNIERGYSYSPFTLYGNLSYASGTLRDPSLIKSGVDSQTVSANYVHIFGPTLTNESFAAASYYLNNFNPTNQSLNTSAALNYPYVNFLNNGSTQIPQLGYGNNSGIPLYQGPDFTTGQSFSRKISIDFGDNITKVYKQHTVKVGFYFEKVSNNQLTATNATQGSISEYGTYGSYRYPTPGGGYGFTSPNNTIGNFFFGNTNYYSVAAKSPIIDMYYYAIDGFVTDSYKVTRRLTLDGGVRFDHLGPWTDPHHVGPAFWYPQNYVTPGTAYTTGINFNQFPGIDWHGRNKSISDSVELGRWAFVSPRGGFAYDAYGTGRTIFNGGLGLYRSHDSWNDYVGSLGTALGAVSSYINNVTLQCADAIGRGIAASIPVCAGYGAPAGGVNQTYLASSSYSIVAADPKDDQQPLTFTYSFGVNQAIKRVGNVVINYVGNQSSNLLLTNGFVGNVNTIKQGGLFAPDPNPLSPGYGVIPATPDNVGSNNGTLVDDYRPYPFYNRVQVLRHALHSNYNGLQTTWSKYTGRFHYNFNYTWSKALGDRGVDRNGSAPDATNIRNDYGVAAFDRTHVFNASYTFIEGKLFHVNNRIESGFINNWEISGITNIQSGPNIQASYGNNFQLSVVNTVTTGPCSLSTTATAATACPTDSSTYLGTPDILLQPIMTCDPSTNLKKGQFINSSCLTLGNQGVNGPFHYPYIRGPYFFNSDLSAQKSFHVGEKKELLFRYSAFNFMNHPLTSLVASEASPLRLVISGIGGAANSAFGIADYKQGRRVSEVTVRFNF